MTDKETLRADWVARIEAAHNEHWHKKLDWTPELRAFDDDLIYGELQNRSYAEAYDCDIHRGRAEAYAEMRIVIRKIWGKRKK